MNDKTVCQECEYGENHHAFDCPVRYDGLSCKCHIIPIMSPEIDLARERDEARAWAIYWRKMYDAELRKNADLDGRAYIAEDERSEAVRDLCDAETEIKRLRLMVMERPITDGCKAIPNLYDNIGDVVVLAWCRHCGGDMQVVRPGVFRCEECGK